MSAKYQHKQEDFSKYRFFENGDEKDNDVMHSGFTQDDRITGFNDLTADSPPFAALKEEDSSANYKMPISQNPNQISHPFVLGLSKEEFTQRKQKENEYLMNSNNINDNDSSISTDSSVIRVNKTFANKRNNPKYFRNNDHSGSLQDLFEQIDLISQNQKIIGFICVVIAVVSWVTMSQILKRLQKTYGNTYSISYCIVSSLSFLLIFYFILHSINKYQSAHQFTDNAYKTISVSKNEFSVCKSVILPSFLLLLLYLGSQYLWLLSLKTTMVSVNTTIFQSNIAMIYIFSIIFLNGNALSFQKNVAVVFCYLGICAVILGAYKNQDTKSENQLNGILECIASTTLYSIYSVFLKYIIQKFYENNTADLKVRNTILLQGMMGLICALFCWIGLVILDESNQEHFKFPKETHQQWRLVIAMICNCLFTVSFGVGITLTNPMIMVIGLSMVLPISYFSDIILHQISVETWAILGTVCMAIGFLMMELPVFYYSKIIYQKLCNANETWNDL